MSRIIIYCFILLIISYSISSSSSVVSNFSLDELINGSEYIVEAIPISFSNQSDHYSGVFKIKEVIKGNFTFDTIKLNFDFDLLPKKLDIQFFYVIFLNVNKKNNINVESPNFNLFAVETFLAKQFLSYEDSVYNDSIWKYISVGCPLGIIDRPYNYSEEIKYFFPTELSTPILHNSNGESIGDRVIFTYSFINYIKSKIKNNE